MRSPDRRLLVLLATAAAAIARRSLLVTYVGDEADAVALQRKQRHVQQQWAMMQTEYVAWSLRCLLVAGTAPASTPPMHRDGTTVGETCSMLEVHAPADDLRRGHIVHSLMRWLSGDGSQPTRFDFVLKAELSTLVCFTMMTDLIDAATIRFRQTSSSAGGERLYLGQLETCTRVQHAGLARRGDELADRAFVEDVLGRKDASCYPPYMQGLGYVLSAALVREIGAMSRVGSLARLPFHSLP